LRRVIFGATGYLHHIRKHSGGLRVARGGCVAKAHPLAARPVEAGPGQFLGCYVVDRVLSTRLLDEREHSMFACPNFD